MKEEWKIQWEKVFYLFNIKLENDILIAELRKKASEMKNESIGKNMFLKLILLVINNKINCSIKITEEMDSKFNKSNSLMGITMEKLASVMEVNSRIVCYAIIFIFIISRTF